MENSGFASPTLGQHISTFPGYFRKMIGEAIYIRVSDRK
jgi:hypothetical protein